MLAVVIGGAEVLGLAWLAHRAEGYSRATRSPSPAPYSDVVPDQASPPLWRFT
jgi:hypothetical protein